MFEKSYTAFVAGLPDISWEDRKLSLSVHDFREQARNYISGRDEALLDLFFLPNDHAQILRLLNKQEPDNTLQTVYALKQLEDGLMEPMLLLPYMNEFVTDFQEDHLKFDVAPEDVLSWMYYDYMQTVDNKLVRDYAVFVLNLKNLVTALNCRKYGKEIHQAVIGENEFAVALRSMNSKDFGLSLDYPYVEKVIALMENINLVERERGIDLLIWDFLDEAVIFEYFSIERVISFMLKLMIIERWSKMSSESGRKVFVELVEKLNKSMDLQSGIYNK